MPESVLCPLPTALVTNPNVTCRDFLAKTAKIIFQRVETANIFVTGTNPIEEASSWSALPDAAGSTKVVVSPFLFTVEFGEQTIFTGGENYDGGERQLGNSTTPIIAEWKRPTGAEVAALKQLRRETALGVIFVDASGNFLAKTVTTGHTSFPISLETFAVTDPTRGTTAADEFTAKFMFQLAEGWFSDFAIIPPETGFAPLTAIIPS